MAEEDKFVMLVNFACQPIPKKTEKRSLLYRVYKSLKTAIIKVLNQPVDK